MLRKLDIQSVGLENKAEESQLQDTYRLIDISFIPPQIKLDHLHSNGKLLTDEQISTVLELKLDEGRNKKIDINEKITSLKKEININYDIVYINDEYYAIYLGKKHKRNIGSGGSGNVKAAQNIKTGDWFAYKIKSRLSLVPNKVNQSNQESNALNKLGRLKGSFIREFTKQKAGDATPLKKINREILMAFEEGVTLKNILDTKKIRGIKLFKLFLELLKAVNTLHEKFKIGHGDLVTVNIICDVLREKVTIIDFEKAIVLLEDRYNEYGFSIEVKNDFLMMIPSLAELMGFILNNQSNEYEIDPSNQKNLDVNLLERLKILFNEPPEKLFQLETIYNLEQHYFASRNNIIKMGYFNLKEYKNLSSEEKKIFIESFREMDEIYLVNNEVSDVNQRDYHEIKQELSQLGLVVHNKVILYTSELSLIRAMQDMPKTTEQRTYERYFTSFNKESEKISLPSVTSQIKLDASPNYSANYATHGMLGATQQKQQNAEKEKLKKDVKEKENRKCTVS